MDIDAGGKRIRIMRNFDKNNKNCTLIDMETGREYSGNTENITALLGGLTESGFRNTISVEQLKARTDQELAEEVRNYVTNLSLTKSNEVDVAKALAFLVDKRKELEEEGINTKLQTLDQDIKEELKIELLAEELTLKLQEVEDQEFALVRKRDLFAKLLLPGEFSALEDYQEYLDRFPVIEEKYRNYTEAKQQIDLFLEKQIFITDSLSKYQEDLTDQFRQEIEELETLKYDISAREEEKFQLKKQQEALYSRAKKRQVSVSMILGVSGLALLLYFMGKNSLLAGVGSAVLLSGAFYYLWMVKGLGAIRKTADQQYGKKEQTINLLKKRVNSILTMFQVEDEKGLKHKYEEALKQEMASTHLIRQGKEIKEQSEQLNRKTSVLEKEILEYLNRLAGKIHEEGITDGLLPKDSWLKETELFIAKQKESIGLNLELFHKESEDLRIRREKLKWELLSIEGWEDKLFEKQQLYEELKEQKRKNDVELEAVKLSIETINSLSADIHDSFGKKLNELVSGFGYELTGQKYRDIKVDEKLNIKAGHNDNYVLINRLSAGTIEQLYLALRLAIAELVYEEDIMPILIDDGFALYDDNRARSALCYLDAHRKGQVILFTCHNREKTLLDKLNINYHYIEL
jgi:DNA repair exonuclease SbcCD ATPase subunit